MGIRNEDPRDHALSSRVAASSFMKGLEPENAVNGWNRVTGKSGNAWAPDLKTEGPHWIRFDLQKQTLLNTVHITSEKTCPDMQIEAMRRGKWMPVADIRGSHARRKVLRFEPVETQRIRLVAMESPRPVRALRSAPVQRSPMIRGLPAAFRPADTCKAIRFSYMLRVRAEFPGKKGASYAFDPPDRHALRHAARQLPPSRRSSAIKKQLARL